MTNATGNYALVNGINLYYETHGTGDPLVMIHGGFGTVDMFAAITPDLAKSHQLIIVELQAHGHTEDIDRPFSFEAMSDDVAALIKHLGHEQVDILGYSLGGGVTLQTVVRHPDLIRKVVLISAPFKRHGWYPEDLAGMAMVNGEIAKT
ncbi:MAG: alpha/beta hydrolase, partial [Chloroflexia bacterium]